MRSGESDRLSRWLFWIYGKSTIPKLLAPNPRVLRQPDTLDQLLLVSHDDAFEGKIEHAILLEKMASVGSRIVVTQ